MSLNRPNHPGTNSPESDYVLQLENLEKERKRFEELLSDSKNDSIKSSIQSMIQTIDDNIVSLKKTVDQKPDFNKDTAEYIKQLEQRLEAAENNAQSSQAYKNLEKDYKKLQDDVIQNPFSNPIHIIRMKMSYQRMLKKQSKVDYWKIMKQSFYGWQKFGFFKSPQSQDIIIGWNAFDAAHKEKAQAKKGSAAERLLESKKWDITYQAYKAWYEQNKDSKDATSLQDANKLRNPYK